MHRWIVGFGLNSPKNKKSKHNQQTQFNNSKWIKRPCPLTVKIPEMLLLKKIFTNTRVLKFTIMSLHLFRALVQRQGKNKLLQEVSKTTLFSTWKYQRLIGFREKGNYLRVGQFWNWKHSEPSKHVKKTWLGHVWNKQSSFKILPFSLISACSHSNPLIIYHSFLTSSLGNPK